MTPAFACTSGVQVQTWAKQVLQITLGKVCVHNRMDTTYQSHKELNSKSTAREADDFKLIPVLSSMG
ncbi:hypothetical protein PABG_11098 [Paracoccidioides brasiliensis Pb03]|nr:hypothetical protein PABG_11098 [Paracoccidioides brasiliensis Pb03]